MTTAPGTAIAAASESDAVTALDPVFAQMATATVRHAWEIPQLSDREKVFLSVTADVCQQTLGLPFALHLRSGLSRGIVPADIRAVLQLISYDSGYPAALNAFEALDRLESSLGPELGSPSEQDSGNTSGLDRTGDAQADAPLGPASLEPSLVSTGPSAAPSPLPPQVRDRLRQLDGHFAEYFDLQSRMRSSSHFDRLSERERGFVTMSIDVHYQTLGDTFAIHTRRALRGGASHEDARAVVRFLAQFGATRAWQAWTALDAVLTDTPG